MKYDIFLFERENQEGRSGVLGTLNEASVAEITTELNGIYELYMEYPTNGSMAQRITNEERIFAWEHSAEDVADFQPFRIYKITRGLNATTAIYASHASYELLGIPVMPFSATKLSDAMNGLYDNSVQANINPFTFLYDADVSLPFAITEPRSSRAALLGQEGSMLDVYGGEYLFNRYIVKLFRNGRGKDRGFVVRYGSNMTGLEAETDSGELFTGVCPYWKNDETGELVTLPEKAILNSYAAQFLYDRTTTIDLTDQFEQKPTVAQLRAAARAYLSKNGANGLPQSIEVDFVPLDAGDSSQGLPAAVLLDGEGNVVSVDVQDGASIPVYLGDIVTVEHEALGISYKAKVVRTVWDCLRERYVSITVGTLRQELSDTIAEIESAECTGVKRYLPISGGSVYGALDVLGIPMVLSNTTLTYNNLVPAVLTGSSARFDFAVPLSRPLATGAAVTCDSLSLILRHPDGGYPYIRSGSGGGTYTQLGTDKPAIWQDGASVRNNEVTGIECFNRTDSIRVQVTLDYALAKASGNTAAVTNNVPLTLDINATFTIS